MHAKVTLVRRVLVITPTLMMMRMKRPAACLILTIPATLPLLTLTLELETNLREDTVNNNHGEGPCWLTAPNK